MLELQHKAILGIDVALWLSRAASSLVVWLLVSIAICLWLLDRSDLPFIRGLPNAPGVPIFGNLIQLGQEHPRKLAELSRKHGPVFQFRLGNKVSLL